MNLVILTGRLGMDPTVRFIPNGTAVANFRMATTDSWRGRDGQRQERTEWHNVVVWGKLAETVGKYLAKGRLVTVTGSLHTRKWEDREKVTRYSTEVTGQRIEFLDSGNRNGAAKQEAKAAVTPEVMPAEESSIGNVPDAAMPTDEQLEQEINNLMGEEDQNS